MVLVFTGCTTKTEDNPAAPTNEPVSPDSTQIVIIGAAYAAPPVVTFDSWGDIWMSTWAEDDNLYFTWGGGNGPTNPPFATDAGIAMFVGDVPDFINTNSPFECIRSIHVPDGTADRDDKPSSILSIDGRLYYAGHTPMGDADFGYIAYSDDYGFSWTEMPDSPWTKAVSSPFRILMFINMGRNYEWNVDGFVYAFGIGHEWAWEDGTVRLCRVQVGSILDYNAYRYYTGTDSSGIPDWSDDQDDAIPLETLKAHALVSSMFHYGTQHYLFMTKNNLYASTNPWGPWYTIRIENDDNYASWDGGYMPGMIAKNAGPHDFYFTLAGQDTVITYNCHFGKIELDIAEVMP